MVPLATIPLLLHGLAQGPVRLLCLVVHGNQTAATGSCVCVVVAVSTWGHVGRKALHVADLQVIMTSNSAKGPK